MQTTTGKSPGAHPSAGQKSAGEIVQPVSIGRQFVVLSLVWSIVVFTAMGLDIWNTRQKNLQAGLLQARISLEKDILFRTWNTQLGGVYGVISSQLQANPHLQLAERDVMTTTGLQLTLINPAYMMRQVHELVSPDSVLSGHITSLKPIRPANRPDEWERAALLRFEQGEKEVSSLVSLDGEEYMRVMRPFPVVEACLKCHGDQGYKIGDIRGGISARIAMQEMRAISSRHILSVVLLYSGIWLVGLCGLGYGSKRLSSQIRQRMLMETALLDFKHSLDNIYDSVLMFDTDSLEFFYSNKGAWSLTGFSEDELRGKALPDLIDSQQVGQFYQLLGPLYCLMEESVLFETWLVHRDGHLIPVEIHMAYVIPREGLDRFLVVVRNISERKNAEREKESLQVQLLQGEKLQSVGRLAAGIAHEINTPIQYISANVAFLQESHESLSQLLELARRLLADERSDTFSAGSRTEFFEACAQADWEYLQEEIPQAIKQSLEGLQRVGSLVQAMKEFSHPGSKQKSPEDLNALVETTVKVSKNEWKYVAELHTDLAADLPFVPCLRSEIGQVLLNLIVNAAQAIAALKNQDMAMTEKGRIVLTTGHSSDWAIITVQDSGTGIPAEILGRIFDPFFTTKEVGKGSGQGLAICRDVIVEKHQGQLTCSSTPGNGSVFTIKLPLQNHPNALIL